jgi:hypothetical protein
MSVSDLTESGTFRFYGTIHQVFERVSAALDGDVRIDQLGDYRGFSEQGSPLAVCVKGEVLAW